MDAPTAAAIGSICATVVGLATLLTNIWLARQGSQIHDAVNGLAQQRVTRARSEGRAAGRRSQKTASDLEHARRHDDIITPGSLE